MNVNLRAVRDVNTGFGDGLAAAFEMVATPALFGFLGHLLDEKLGIGPVFLLSFAIFVFGYECWKLFARYNAEMDRHLADMQMARRSTTASETPDGQVDDATGGRTRNPSRGGSVEAST